MIRHLINCLELPLQYDSARRQDLLQKLHCRGASKTDNSGDTVVFKTEYSPQLRRFKIKAHVDRLFDKLRAELRDDSFLRDARVVIAHPSRRSQIVDTYCWNYVQDDNQLGKRVRRGSFLLTEQKSFDKEKIYQSRLDESKQRYLD